MPLSASLRSATYKESHTDFWNKITARFSKMSAGDVLLLIMAAILPPLPVAIKRGICSGAFFLNLLLSILAYIPGMIHAWYIILKYPEQIHPHHSAIRQQQRDLERNPVTGTFPGAVYQPVQSPSHQISEGNQGGVYGTLHPSQQQQQQHKPQDRPSAGGANYGTVSGQQHVQPPAYSPVDHKDQARA